MRANHRVSVDAGARKAAPSPASSALEMFSSLNSAPRGGLARARPVGGVLDATRARLFKISSETVGIRAEAALADPRAAPSEVLRRC